MLRLQGIPRTGALAEKKSEETVAEALIGLRESLGPSLDSSKALARDFLVKAPWHIHGSKVPVLGPIIARLRGLWNSVWRLQEKLAVVQEILVSMDRETIESRRIQAEAMHDLQRKVSHLETRIRALEEPSSKSPKEEKTKDASR